MADPVDLTIAPIAATIDGASRRGQPLALAYVDAEGRPALSIRGSTHVHRPEQLAIWARRADDGLAAALAERDAVSLLLFATVEGKPEMLLTIRGRGRVAPEANDEVYAAIPASERDHDPERKGVAVIVEVDRVQGMRAEGPIDQAR